MYLSVNRNKINGTCQLHEEEVINPIFKEAKSGKLKKLRRHLDGSPDLFTITDAFRDTLLHHAAYGNAFKVAAYLDSVNDSLNSLNAIGQTPFMTSCLSGSFETAALLLHRCKDIDERDKTRLAPIHFACRSGNTALVSMLVLCGASLETPDSDNRLPLHFAAECGSPNMCSLLLRFYPEAVEHQDTRKDTPLHLACGSGNIGIASGILKSTLYPSAALFKIINAECLRTFSTKAAFNLSLRNVEGQTPEHIAGSRGYYEVAEMVQYELYKSQHAPRVSPQPSSVSLAMYFLCGRPGRRRAMYFWMLAISFGWLYPYMYLRIYRSSVDFSVTGEVAFICVNIVLWVCYFMEVFKNPGFLPINSWEYEEEMKELFMECRRLQKRTTQVVVEGKTPETELLPLQVQALWRSIRALKQRLNSLCHTCGCVKPLRAKHCALCNRCVRVMDHHCPVTDNCVGQENRLWFLLTSVMVAIVSSWMGWLSFRYWKRADSTSLWELLTWVILSTGWMFGINAFFMTISSAVLNITTNELVNWRRYEHFGNRKTGFKNPFDRGLWKNLVEFFCPRRHEAERELHKQRMAVEEGCPLVI